MRHLSKGNFDFEKLKWDSLAEYLNANIPLDELVSEGKIDTILRNLFVRVQGETYGWGPQSIHVNEEHDFVIQLDLESYNSEIKKIANANSKGSTNILFFKTLFQLTRFNNPKKDTWKIFGTAEIGTEVDAYIDSVWDVTNMTLLGDSEDFKEWLMFIKLKYYPQD